MEIVASFIFFGFLLVSSSLKFVIQHERIVVFRFGRLLGVRGPGPVLVAPIIETFKKVDMRQVASDMQELSAATKDGQVALVHPICYLQVDDPVRVVTEVVDPYETVRQLLNSDLQNLCLEYDGTAIVEQREAVCERLRTVLDKQTANFGLRVVAVKMMELVSVSPDSSRARLSSVSQESPSGLMSVSQRLSEPITLTPVVPELEVPSTPPPSQSAPAPAAITPSQFQASDSSSADTEVSLVAEPEATESKPEAAEIREMPAAEVIAVSATASNIAAELGWSSPEIVTQQPSQEYMTPAPVFASLDFMSSSSSYDVFLASLSGPPSEPAAEPTQEVVQSVESAFDALKPAVTGVARATHCRSCEKPLDSGTLCFNCWELN